MEILGTLTATAFVGDGSLLTNLPSGGDGGTLDHADLTDNLDYASSGHTGFAGTGVSNTFTSSQSVIAATSEASKLGLRYTDDVMGLVVEATGISGKGAMFLNAPLGDGITGGKAFVLNAIGETTGRAVFGTDGSLTIGSGTTARDTRLARDTSGGWLMTGVASQPALRVKGHASQSTSLQTWTNSSNTVLASISQSGSLTAASITATHAINSGVVALTDTSTIPTDASLGNLFTVTLGGNRTLGNPTNGVNGQRATWRIKQDDNGGRTITLGSNFRLGTDITAVTLTTTADKTDYLTAIYNAADTKWDVVSLIRGF